MWGFLERAIAYGISDQLPVDRRRIRTINVVAYIAAFFNALYVIIFLIVDPVGLFPVIISNAFWVGVGLVAVAINGRGQTNVAMWVLFLAGLFNLTAASLLLGNATGVYLFMIVLPVAATLITPAGDLRTPLIFITVSLIAFVAVVLADTPTPASIEGTGIETLLLANSLIGTVAFVALFPLYFRRLADVAEAGLQEANERNEALLLNILPQEIANRLKAGEEVIADRAEGVSVLFADLVDSTPMSERLTPTAMVGLLNGIFTPFDDLADELGLEKIKTVGDAYMVVGGLPVERTDHLEAIADMALRMREEIEKRTFDGIGQLSMRYGIDTGPVVAGVIGKRKFSYDLWGDTVNTAARMESHGVPGRIQVTPEVRNRLDGRFEFAERGEVEIKGKGTMTTYFLESRVL